jgi:DNA-binding MarR family transcriptional regulator
MPKPISIAHHQALSRTDKARAVELAQTAKKLSDLELKVSVTRSQLDGMLFYWHEDGRPITELARAAGVSRETAYKSIDRYRQSISPELPFERA